MINNIMYKFEQEYWGKSLQISGVDEVGRGCLAGPVVTSAVILSEKVYHPNLIDSKKLSPAKLLQVYQWLINHCTYSIGVSSNRIIDKHNIYQATAMTMKSSLLHLFDKAPKLPSLILVDAMPINLACTPYANIEIQSFTQGESKSASIAAASIIAKVTRDSIIARMGETFPSYGLAKHKGYGTAQHYASLRSNQASIIHRQTFLKNFLTEQHHEQQLLF
ncbi:MAG: ribonuclease HII [Candidatus Dependentiae bacterium]|nr:ribonuclease HII [Candidatus Dependentiae bacterium]